ncbi:MAG: MFS transporter [Spirochaetia bacterium]
MSGESNGRKHTNGGAPGTGPAPDSRGGPDSFPVASTLLLVGVFFLTFLARSVLAPLLLPIEEDLGISHAEAGSFFLFISAGLMITMLFSGFVSRWANHHRTVALSVALVGMGLLALSVSYSLLWFRVALFFIGAGAGLYLPSGIATLTEVAHTRQWGRALALHELGPILGLSAGPLVAELALRFSTWRAMYAALGLVALCAAVVFARYGAGGRFHGAPPRWSALREVTRHRRFWVISFFFVMAIGLELGVYSMLPTYLVVERGMGQSLVNTLVSTSRLTSLVMVFAAGWLSDVFGVRRVIAAVAVASGAVTALLGWADGALLIAAVYLQPMLISAFFPAGLSALAGVGSPEHRNLSVSVVIPVAYLFGAGALPSILGRLAEADAFGLGFIGVGALMAAGAALTPALGAGNTE